MKPRLVMSMVFNAGLSAAAFATPVAASAMPGAAPVRVGSELSAAF